LRLFRFHIEINGKKQRLNNGTMPPILMSGLKRAKRVVKSRLRHTKRQSAPIIRKSAIQPRAKSRVGTIHATRSKLKTRAKQSVVALTMQPWTKIGKYKKIRADKYSGDFYF
jgi:hypothetical protein